MNLSEACQTLGVSPSGYHAHRRKHQRPRRRHDEQLATEIRAAFTTLIHRSGFPILAIVNECLAKAPRQPPHAPA